MSFLPDTTEILKNLEIAYQEFLKAENLEDTSINRYGFYQEAERQLMASDEIDPLLKSLLFLKINGMKTDSAIRVKLNLPMP